MKDCFKRPFKSCYGQPGIVCDLNLVSIEDNIKYKSDIPLTVYIDFETAAPTSSSDYLSRKQIACIDKFTLSKLKIVQ